MTVILAVVIPASALRAMALPFAQRVPWSYLFIAAVTTGSFLLTFRAGGD